MEKYFTPRVLTIVFGTFLLANIMTMCSVNSTSKMVSKLTKEIDTLNRVVIQKQEVEKIIKVEGLKISKRMLYDNNLIVRNPNMRPDDKMNEYDLEIAKLEKK
mgnify:FL=1